MAEIKMARQIRILALFVILHCNSISAIGQGLSIQKVEKSDIIKKQVSFSLSEGNLKKLCPSTQQRDGKVAYYNFDIKSGQELPPYSYYPYKKYRSLLNEKQDDGSLRRNVSLHYLNLEKLLIVLNPYSGVLMVKNKTTKSEDYLNVNGKPFGLCYGAKEDKLYLTGFKSRSVQVLHAATGIWRDSIQLNGMSGRYMVLDQEERRLYVGVRSSKSVALINLEKERLSWFVKVDGKPGSLILSGSSLLVFHSNAKILSKFNADNLQHQESKKISVIFKGIKHLSNEEYLLKGIKTDYLLKDEFWNNTLQYSQTVLDSSGRYTWIVSSYTETRWALLKKREFEEKGIKCYLSAMTNGYFRLCAGLYQNQEEAVKERQKFEILFQDSWLMTIHPHKF